MLESFIKSWRLALSLFFSFLYFFFFLILQPLIFKLLPWMGLQLKSIIISMCIYTLVAQRYCISGAAYTKIERVYKEITNLIHGCKGFKTYMYTLAMISKFTRVCKSCSGANWAFGKRNACVNISPSVLICVHMWACVGP